MMTREEYHKKAPAFDFKRHCYEKEYTRFLRSHPKVNPAGGYARRISNLLKKKHDV